MDDSAVQKQLDNMTSFIRREAEERANEILVLAEEEFTIEKAKIVQTQKLKLMKEYERKERQVDVHKKIIYSNALNVARLEKLRAEQKEVDGILGDAKAKLASITSGASYRDILVKLILQGLLQVDEDVISVKCRAEDADLVKSILPEAAKQYKALVPAKNPKLSVSSEKIQCSGGVILSALEDRILCDNTLDTRLNFGFDAALPKIRYILFAEAADIQ